MKRPLSNLFSLLAGDVGSRLLGFLITAYLARVLAPSAFGIINIGLAVLGYLMLLGSPGLQLLEARNAAAVSGANEQRVNSILSLRLVLAGSLLVLVTLASFLTISSSEMRESVVLFCVSVIPLSLFLDWFFQGKEQFGLLSVARLAMYLVYGVVVLLNVHSAADIVWVPVGFAAGNLTASVLLFFGYKQFGKLSFVWQPDEWKSILRSSVPVGLAMLLAQSAINLPPIVLGWFASTAEAGLFSAALKIVFVLLMLDRMVNALLLPAVTRHFVSRKDHVPFFLTVVTKVVLIVVLPLTVLGILSAPTITPAVFGKGYADAVPLLRILLGYFFLTLLNSVFVCSLVGAGKEKEYTSALNAGSAILVTGIVAGAIFFGSTGVAVGIVAGELCTVIFMIRQTRRIVNIPLFRVFVSPLIAAVLMVAIAFLFAEQPILVQSGASILVFAAVVILTRGVALKEIQFLRERFV
ncbi:MAG: oligosaccharide flippase family protein [Bacteroidetes bacterium]|nr:oligosaccharide flippase family protein [Bacteroidota bacterium]MCW5895266.1 oligosaccharide flippase family protein [Bacteroidota bacterium]